MASFKLPVIESGSQRTQPARDPVQRRTAVTAELTACIATDVNLTHVAVSDDENAPDPSLHLVATAAGRCVYLWSKETLALVGSLGRHDHSLHKVPITTIGFCRSAEFLAAAEQRIIVWDVRKQHSHRALAGHKGLIFSVAFSSDDVLLFSAAADGKVLVWDWRAGTQQACLVQHDAIFRHVCVSRWRLGVAGNDGSVRLWDAGRGIELGEIKHDESWNVHAYYGDATLAGWVNPTIGHTGPITCAAFSPNGRLVATASRDNTCKLWDALSYLKDAQEKASEEYGATHTDYRVNLAAQELEGQETGNAPLLVDYHADLMFTFRHEAPCIAVHFSAHNEVLITSSQDTTCRVWSTMSGALLYQINAPGPIQSSEFDAAASRLYLACEARLMVISLHWLADVPDRPLWASQETGVSPRKFAASTSLESIRVFPRQGDLNELYQQHMTVDEVRRLLARGTMAPGAVLHGIVVGANMRAALERVLLNMQEYNVNAAAIVRALCTYTRYSLVRILEILANPDSSSAAPLLDAIRKGQSLVSILEWYGLIAGSQAATSFSFGENRNTHARDTIPQRQTLRPGGVIGSGAGAGIVHFQPTERRAVLRRLDKGKHVAPVHVRETFAGRTYPNFGLRENRSVPATPVLNASVARQQTLRPVPPAGRSPRQHPSPRAAAPAGAVAVAGLDLAFSGRERQVGAREMVVHVQDNAWVELAVVGHALMLIDPVRRGIMR